MEKVEVWKDIKGWEGLYQVSDLGRVRSLPSRIYGSHGPVNRKGRVLSMGGSARYSRVRLSRPGLGKGVVRMVHDLVLEAFVGPKPRGREVCHGPLGRYKNTLSNLRYDTRSENVRDQYRFGERKKSSK